VSRARLAAAAAAIALLGAPLTATRAVAAAVAPVEIPLTDLGYRDGVTVVGAAPSITFDLPRYASLEGATLVLLLHAAAEAAPSSTIEIAVNGRPVLRRTLGQIGTDPRLVVPLPLPAARAQTFVVSVTGALRVAGDPCAADAEHRLFLRIDRESGLVLRTATGGTAEAFFRDYRGAIDVIGPADDPALAAVPYRIDRLESWHRVDATLVTRPRPGHRTLILTRGGPTVRRGDVLQTSFAAFAALPTPRGESPAVHDGSIAFANLRQHLGSSTGTGELAFDVPLAASVVGGVPGGLHVHAVVAHSALPAGASGTLQVLMNGVLVGARTLDAGAGLQTIDAAVPASVVGPSNDLRVVLAPEVPRTTCVAGTNAMTATLLGRSTFSWSGIEPRAPTIEAFLTALHGRVALLVAPPFTPAAFHFLNELGKMNSAIEQLDVERYDGSIPAGYDAAILFAPPQALGGDFGLPIRPRAAAFAVVDPTADVDVLSAGRDSSFALLQVGAVRATPLLAASYHGDPGAIESIATVRAAQLATQVAGVTVLDARGATTYEIGEKLRVTYPGEGTFEALWARFRIVIAGALIVLIVAAACYAARRLTGRTIG